MCFFFLIAVCSVSIFFQKKTRINKAGELVITSERTRSQITNFADCLQKIKDRVEEVTRKPREPTERDQAVFYNEVGLYRDGFKTKDPLGQTSRGPRINGKSTE